MRMTVMPVNSPGPRKRPKFFIALAACLFALAGCTALEPIFLSEQSTAAPSTSGVLSDLERAYPRDWQVPLNDGPTALQWRLRAIDTATVSIDLQSFIWKFDKVGGAIHDRLIAAADRGVDVKILIDDSFLAGEDKSILELHQHENIQYRVYNPYKRRSSGELSRTLLNLSEFGRLDHRMHNKIMVVDNRVAIVGGRNLADEYFGFDTDANFRDMELLMGGPVVRELSASFDDYFNDHWSYPVDRISHVAVVPTEKDDVPSAETEVGNIYSPQSKKRLRSEWFGLVRKAHRGKPQLYVDRPPAKSPGAEADKPVQVAGEIRKIIEGARDEIIIVSAYLIPTKAVSSVLKEAVDRGVRVRLLTNSINSNNHLSAYAAYRGHIFELLSFGTEVHEVRASAADRERYILPPVALKKLGLHAKYMIVDRTKVFVGSSNLDPRSLRINTEIGVLVDSPSLARELRQVTEPDFDTVNAWELGLDEDGSVYWFGGDIKLKSEPARSTFQRLEEWFFAHLPIEAEL
jgi:putative cardiolipin synthase